MSIGSAAGVRSTRSLRALPVREPRELVQVTFEGSRYGENWGDSTNKFHSVNANLNSVLGGGKVNEFVFQYSYFKNAILERSNLPTEVYPGGVTVGQSVNTPQQTEQHKYQFRDDFTFSKGRHEFKVGASFINEPVLDITFSTGQSPNFTHLTDSRTSAISNITFNGSIGGAGGSVGPSLTDKGVRRSPLEFAAAIWNKAPAMTAAVRMTCTRRTGFPICS